MRLLVTLALLVIFRVVALIPLPGIDTSNLNFVSGPPDISVMVLGVRSFAVAFAAVELLSFVIPMWDALRRGGIAGRRKLNAFATRAGVGWALIQAAGIAVALQRQDSVVANPGLLFVLSTAMMLVAGAALAFFLAQLISRWGIGNGFCWVLVLDFLWRALVQTRDLLSSGILWNPLEFLVWIAAIAALVRTFSRRPQAALLGFQQEVVPVNLPAFPQGILPVSWTFVVLSFFFAADWPLALLVVTVVITALSLAAFYLFSSHKRLESNLPAGALPAEGEVWTGGALFQSTVVLAVFGASFLGGTWFLNFRFAEILGFTALIMLVALAFDLIAEWTFRQRHGDSVAAAIEMDNVYCACYLQGLLAKDGIGSLLRSFHFRSLSFFFGPIVKMELIVPIAELNRARQIIRPDRIEIV
jgi:SecY translocase